MRRAQEIIQPAKTKRSNLLLHLLARFLMWLIGWRAQGPVPEIPKFVVVMAPHTSFWDAFVAFFMSYSLRVYPKALIKDSAFRGPWGGVLKYFGGIPIDRNRHHNTVDQAVEAIRESDEIAFAMAPEGTRKNAGYWKSGFYHIARKANVPLVLGFMDYRRKTAGRGPIFYPTGDIEADLAEIRKFYDTITACRPENVTPVRFRDRSSTDGGSRQSQGEASTRRARLEASKPHAES